MHEAKKDPYDLFGPCFKTSTWQSQYKNLGTVVPIAMGNVIHRPSGTHKMPLVGKTPRGRPSEKKRKRSMQDIFKTHHDSKAKKVKLEHTHLSQTKLENEIGECCAI